MIGILARLGCTLCLDRAMLDPKTTIERSCDASPDGVETSALGEGARAVQVTSSVVIDQT